jgi:hypothetical protein
MNMKVYVEVNNFMNVDINVSVVRDTDKDIDINLEIYNTSFHEIAAASNSVELAGLSNKKLQD